MISAASFGGARSKRNFFGNKKKRYTNKRENGEKKKGAGWRGTRLLYAASSSSSSFRLISPLASRPAAFFIYHLFSHPFVSSLYTSSASGTQRCAPYTIFRMDPRFFIHLARIPAATSVSLPPSVRAPRRIQSSWFVVGDRWTFLCSPRCCSKRRRRGPIEFMTGDGFLLNYGKIHPAALSFSSPRHFFFFFFFLRTLTSPHKQCRWLFGAPHAARSEGKKNWIKKQEQTTAVAAAVYSASAALPTCSSLIPRDMYM